MNNGNQPNIVPFGKYKGQPIEALAGDQKYIEWLNGQGWVKDRYPQFYTVIINNFQEPSDTPEHNALQAMFLDDKFCLQFASMIGGRHDKDCLLKGIHSKRFEVGGIDIVLEYNYWALNSKDDWWAPWARCAIEIKPSLGDDFPSILRQARRMVEARGVGSIDYQCVVFRDFTATSVTLEQVRAMFEHSGVVLISLDEILEVSVRLYPDKEELEVPNEIIDCTPEEIINWLLAHKMNIEVKGEKFIVAGDVSWLNDSVRSTIRNNKLAIMRLLTREREDHVDD